MLLPSVDDSRDYVVTFTIHRGDNRVRLFRRRYERYADCCVLEQDRFGVGGGGSVLVSADIAHDIRPNLVAIEWNLNAQRYRDEILARHVTPLSIQLRTL